MTSLYMTWTRQMVFKLKQYTVGLSLVWFSRLDILWKHALHTNSVKQTWRESPFLLNPWEIPILYGVSWRPVGRFIEGYKARNKRPYGSCCHYTPEPKLNVKMWSPAQ